MQGTTNVSSGIVSILVDTIIQPGKMVPPNAKLGEDWIQTVVPGGRGAERLDVSSDSRELLTASSGMEQF